MKLLGDQVEPLRQKPSKRSYFYRLLPRLFKSKQKIKQLGNILNSKKYINAFIHEHWRGRKESRLLENGANEITKWPFFHQIGKLASHIPEQLGIEFRDNTQDTNLAGLGVAGLLGSQLIGKFSLSRKERKI